MSLRGWGLFIAVGLVLGIAAGLLYGWMIDPVKYVDTEPDSLAAAYKDDYLRLAASAYGATGDLARARARLTALGLPDSALSLSALAQRFAEDGRPIAEVRALARLAEALDSGATAVAQISSPTPPPIDTPALASLTPAIASTETPTATPELPFNTATPVLTATPVVLFQLARTEEKVCRAELGEPLIQVLALDASGKPVPGVEVIVEWEEQGEPRSNRFFTGLKPELGVGYADFTMSDGPAYRLRLAQGREAVPGLRVDMCTASDGSQYPGSWLVVYQQAATSTP